MGLLRINGRIVALLVQPVPFYGREAANEGWDG
jgi:hypothetical protein